jgi:hypothetical protein
VASEPAGIVTDALPPVSVVAAEVYVPLLSVTVPVGVGLLLPPLKFTVTITACAILTLARDGVTATVGVVFVVGGGDVEFPPLPPHDAIDKLAAMLSQNRARRPAFFILQPVSSPVPSVPPPIQLCPELSVDCGISRVRNDFNMAFDGINVTLRSRSTSRINWGLLTLLGWLPRYHQVVSQGSFHVFSLSSQSFRGCTSALCTPVLRTSNAIVNLQSGNECIQLNRG